VWALGTNAGAAPLVGAREMRNDASRGGRSRRCLDVPPSSQPALRARRQHKKKNYQVITFLTDPGKGKQTRHQLSPFVFEDYVPNREDCGMRHWS